MHYIPLNEARTEEAKRIRKRNLRAGKDWTPYRAKVLKLRTDGVVSTLKTGLTRDHYVLVTPRSIRSLAKYFGVTRGFRIVEIMTIAHGGSKNDTIVVVEKKI